MKHNTARVYYANQIVLSTYVRQNETVRFQGLPPDVYNGGYIKYPEGHNFYPTTWSRCDGTPVLLEDVPKELLLMEIIDPLT